MIHLHQKHLEFNHRPIVGFELTVIPIVAMHFNGASNNNIGNGTTFLLCIDNCSGLYLSLSCTHICPNTWYKNRNKGIQSKYFEQKYIWYKRTTRDAKHFQHEYVIDRVVLVGCVLLLLLLQGGDYVCIYFLSLTTPLSSPQMICEWI